MVGEASTGNEAVVLTRELRPDVVLMDVRMPDGDGIDATRHITADPTVAATRVLVLSMFELDEYVYTALRAGASASFSQTPYRTTCLKPSDARTPGSRCSRPASSPGWSSTT